MSGADVRRRKRRELDARRSKSRIRIGVHLQRWCELKERLGLPLHSDLASFLLRSYSTRENLTCTARVIQSPRSGEFVTSASSLLPLVEWVHHHSRECDSLPGIQRASDITSDVTTGSTGPHSHQVRWRCLAGHTFPWCTGAGAGEAEEETSTGETKTAAGERETARSPTETQRGETETAAGGRETAGSPTETRRGETETAAGGRETAGSPAETQRGETETAAGGRETAMSPTETQRGETETVIGERETARSPTETRRGETETAAGERETAGSPTETRRGETETAAGERETARGPRVRKKRSGRNIGNEPAVAADTRPVARPRRGRRSLATAVATVTPWLRSRNKHQEVEPEQEEEAAQDAGSGECEPIRAENESEEEDRDCMNSKEREGEEEEEEREGGEGVRGTERQREEERTGEDSSAFTGQAARRSAVKLQAYTRGSQSVKTEPGVEKRERSRRRASGVDDDIAQIGPKRIRKAAPREILLCEFNGCGKIFSTKQYLNHHRKYQHLQQKTFSCCQPDCRKSFNFKKHLKEHEKLHSDRRDYICEFCARAFRTSSNLIIHRRIHTGEKPLQCEVCGFTCRQKASLNWHMRRHDAESSYLFSCELCGKRFEKRDNVAAHKGKSHPEELPATSLPVPAAERTP